MKYKIYFYMLPINEAFYGKYLINGFEKNGHEVIVKDINMSPREELEFIKSNNFNFIFYMGFSFMNSITQHNHNYFLPEALDIPYAVHWYDNPFRYLNHLKYLKKTKYTFFCCDSNLAKRMKKEGFENTFFSPCCYDESIQSPRKIIPQFNCDISFAGSIFDWTTLVKRRKGCNYKQIQILNQLHKERVAGKYFDYITGLAKYGLDIYSEDFGKLAFLNLKEQKHLLRMENFSTLRGYEVHCYGQGDWKGNKEVMPTLVQHNRNLNQHTHLPYLYASSQCFLSSFIVKSSNRL